MISYIDAYKDQFGVWGHLPRPSTSRSWIYHLTRLPESLSTYPKYESVKR